MLDEKNQKTYALASIVQHYAQLSALQPAEAQVLELLRDRLPRFKMLDIGVGGGRTTQHFAPIAAEYIGIDYSADMVAACQQRFPGSKFAVCDARDMGEFEDNTFDFILFSFNGIDYVSQSDRLKILKEIHRVGKPGSYFCFSSHNLQGFERAFGVRHQLSCNPITTYANLVMLALLRFLNRPINLQQLQTSAYIVVRDESHNFRLETYYIRPEDQIKQLKSYFQDVKVYSWRNELGMIQENDLCDNFDLWVYYFCTQRSS
jgi:ubiquinone/menaquinone biosynthesis C-methylase UbiE